MSRNVPRVCHPWFVVPGFEIRLLGGPRALVGGEEPKGLHKRSRKLLVCMALLPHQRSRWSDLNFDLRRAKSDLKRVLGSYWINPSDGVYQFAHPPRIDLSAIPKTDAEAFTYCVERGDLLPGLDYDAVDWITEMRASHHERLAGIVTRLCKDAVPGEIDAMLQRATRVLTLAEIERIRQADALPVSVAERESDDIDATIRVLVAQIGEPANEQVVVSTLRRLVTLIDQQAIRWQPVRKELLDRTSALIQVYHRRFGFDAESIIYTLANSYMYAGDTQGAFTQLRPWIADPSVSSGMLYLAGLLNTRMGWHHDAHTVLTAALELSTSEGAALILREKRDIALAWGQGRDVSDVARSLRLEPAFDALSPQARASVYCNQARSSTRPMDALNLYQKALETDHLTENPHYHLNLVRAARRTGKPDLAKQHLATFEEMAQTQKATSLFYARLMLRAEEIVREATTTGQDSPQRRAHLEEAGVIYEAVAKGEQTRDIPRTCTTLLGQASIAAHLNRPKQLRALATTVELLAARRIGRHRAKARGFRAQAASQLTKQETDRLDLQASEAVASMEAYLPPALTIASRSA